MAIETKTISGWKWVDSTAFEAARASVDSELGLPIKPSDTTQTSMSEKTNDYGGSTFWYCGEHPQLIPYLGAPITFIINIEVPDVIG